MRLIDKESLFNALAKQRAYEPKHRRTIMRSIQLVSEQPTVDAVPVVHGHWKYNDFDIPYCSQCGNRIKTPGFVGSTEFYETEYMYCQHCGSKMDENE